MRYSTILIALLMSQLAPAETNNPLVHPARGLVGIRVEEATNGIRVAQVGLGTPAEKAGLLPGDVITKIDGRSISSLSIGEACSLMTGATGSIVNVEFFSIAERTTKTVQMRREYVNFGKAKLLREADVEIVPPGTGLLPRWNQTQHYHCYVEKKPIGAPCEWVPMRLALTNGYVAHAGPCFYRDEANDNADYYRIDVELVVTNKGSKVMFEVDMPVDWVTPEKLTGTVDKIIQYDPDTLTVMFDLGTTNFTYKLKDRPFERYRDDVERLRRQFEELEAWDAERAPAP